MVRETIVDTDYPIFIPLRVRFAQFCLPPSLDIFSEVKICTAGVDMVTVDVTTEGGDIDVEV